MTPKSLGGRAHRTASLAPGRGQGQDPNQTRRENMSGPAQHIVNSLDKVRSCTQETSLERSFNKIRGRGWADV